MAAINTIECHDISGTIIGAALGTSRQHFLSMLPRGGGNLFASGHASDLLDTFWEAQRVYLNSRIVACHRLLHAIMLIAMTGNLGEISNTEHLVGAGNMPEFFADDLRSTPPNAGIDFVENEGGGMIFTHQDTFQGQHNP